MKVYAVLNENDLLSIHRTLKGAQEAIIKEVKERGYTEKEMANHRWSNDKTEYLIYNPNPNHSLELFAIWDYNLEK